MNLSMRRMVPAGVVAVALGLGGTLLVANTSGGTTDVKPPPAMSDCKPPPAPCGEGTALEITAADEAARRMIELQTTGSTTVTNPAPSTP